MILTVVGFLLGTQLRDRPYAHASGSIGHGTSLASFPRDKLVQSPVRLHGMRPLEVALKS